MLEEEELKLAGEQRSKVRLQVKKREGGEVWERTKEGEMSVLVSVEGLVKGTEQG